MNFILKYREIQTNLHIEEQADIALKILFKIPGEIGIDERKKFLQ